ncbi:hypothetical protein OG280_37445 [Streptomyces virginiae]
MDDPEIGDTIEAPAQDVARFHEVLAQILTCGRADALLIHVGV